MTLTHEYSGQVSKKEKNPQQNKLQGGAEDKKMRPKVANIN